MNSIGVRTSISQPNGIVSCTAGCGLQLLVHGRDDTLVPISDAEEIYAQRRSDAVILYVLPGGHDATEHIETHSKVLIRFIENLLQ